MFQTLCANLALNNITNVRCWNSALGNTPGEILVPYLDSCREHNFGGLSLGKHQEGEQIPLMTIDSLNLAACHFIKIDVEGMEREVLEGAANTIARLSPLLYVENDRLEKSDSLLTAA